MSLQNFSGQGEWAATADINAITKSYSDVKNRLLNRQEIALLDVREEIPHANGHPLFAASMPLSRLEAEALTSLPRREVPIVLIDGGEGLASLAVGRLKAMGYTDVSVFAGGVQAWSGAGGELFKDINVPSKSFGEFMDSQKHTPMMPPDEVKRLKDEGNVVILDVRRPDEFSAFCIPGANSTPGAEALMKFESLIPNDTIQVICNCAGRTRGQLWAQSLINAGIKNPVAALRNGTIGWTVAGLELSPKQHIEPTRSAPGSELKLSKSVREVADKAGVKRASWEDCLKWQKQDEKTSYFFDVRSHSQYSAGHLPQWRNAPAGEMVQELMMYAPVRGARIVLVDDDGVQANICASWLAQMNCDVWVLDHPPAFDQVGEWQRSYPQQPEVKKMSVEKLAELQTGDVAVIDLSLSNAYKSGHIPGAWFAIRSELAEACKAIGTHEAYVLTDQLGILATFAAAELEQLVTAPVYVLEGGNAAWKQAGKTLEKGASQMASEPIDRFQRPYESTDSEVDVTFDHEKINAYIAWLSGSDLLAQLANDGTSGFYVV